MVNSTTAAPFIPEIWANEALEILRSNIVMAPLVTKDSDLATFQVGSTLHVPYPGTLVANDKKEGSPVTKQTPNSTDTTVKLDHHKEVTILVEDFVRAQAQPILMQSYIHAQVVALSEQIESDIIGTYSSFKGSLGTAGTDLSAATLRAIGKKFDDSKVPQGNRHLIISTKDESALIGDTALQTFFAFNEQQRGDVSNGLIGQKIYGLNLHVSQLVPVVVGTGTTPVTTTNNLAFDPGAIVFASRSLPMANSGMGVVQAVVQDPVSGLILRSTMGYDKDSLGVQVTLDCLYGVAKLRDEKGFVVLS